MSLYLYSLDEWYLMDLCLYFNLWHDDWNLDIFLDLSYLNSSLIDYLWNLYLHYLNFFNNFQNLSDYFNLPWWSFDYFFNCHYLLNYLRNLDYSLLNLDNWNDLLNILFHNLYSCLDMGKNFWNFLILNNFNYFFNYLRN